MTTIRLTLGANRLAASCARLLSAWRATSTWYRPVLLHKLGIGGATGRRYNVHAGAHFRRDQD
jgi:hypothetical protein